MLLRLFPRCADRVSPREGGAIMRRGYFTDGYAAAFFASGIPVIGAALVGFFFVRGRKEDLMPQWGAEETAAAQAH